MLPVRSVASTRLRQRSIKARGRATNMLSGSRRATKGCARWCNLPDGFPREHRAAEAEQRRVRSSCAATRRPSHHARPHPGGRRANTCSCASEPGSRELSPRHQLIVGLGSVPAAVLRHPGTSSARSEGRIGDPPPATICTDEVGSPAAPRGGGSGSAHPPQAGSSCKAPLHTQRIARGPPGPQCSPSRW